MAQLTATIISHDDEFKRQVAQVLRGSGVPIGIVDNRGESSEADITAIDIRSDAMTGMAAIERTRAAHPSMALFAMAGLAEPELILQAMRAGANEYFTWQPAADPAAVRRTEESIHAAVRRTAARRDAASASARPPSATHVFLGAKGGAGTTTVAVNCAV